MKTMKTTTSSRKTATKVTTTTKSPVRYTSAFTGQHDADAVYVDLSICGRALFRLATLSLSRTTTYIVGSRTYSAAELYRIQEAAILALREADPTQLRASSAIASSTESTS